jgi:hypothetical protein
MSKATLMVHLEPGHPNTTLSTLAADQPGGLVTSTAASLRRRNGMVQGGS